MERWRKTIALLKDFISENQLQGIVLMKPYTTDIMILERYNSDALYCLFTMLIMRN